MAELNEEPKSGRSTITIKRRKSLSLKASTLDAEGDAGPVLAGAPGMLDAAAPSYTWPAVLAIVAVLFTVLALLFQWLELKSYNALPNPVFPQPGARSAT